MRLWEVFVSVVIALQAIAIAWCEIRRSKREAAKRDYEFNKDRHAPPGAGS